MIYFYNFGALKCETQEKIASKSTQYLFSDYIGTGYV
jgi:hypothetical protein